MSTTTRTLQNQGHHKVSLFSFVSSRPKETQSHALIWKEIRDLLVIRLASRRPLSVTKGRRTKVPHLSPFSIKSGQLGTGPDGAVPAAEERTLHHVAPIPLRPPSASEREERGNQSLGTFAKSPLCLCCERERPFPQRDHPIPAEIEERGSSARSSGGQMDGLGHLDLGKCQQSQKGEAVAEWTDQELPSASPTLRALFTLGPSEHGPAAQVRQRLPS